MYVSHIHTHVWLCYTCSSCWTSTKLKPGFTTLSQGKLIKAIQPLEYLNVDFKGPLPSRTHNKYLFVMIDEFFLLFFSFAFPCKDTSLKVIIQSLESIFSCQALIILHSDWGLGFLAYEVKEYLLLYRVASSKTIPYHPHKAMLRWNATI